MSRPLPPRPSRRGVLRQGAATVGLGFFCPAPLLAAAQHPGLARTFDVRTFGATGVRGDHATRACQARPSTRAPQRLRPRPRARRLHLLRPREGRERGPIENLRVSNVHLHVLPENARDKRATHALSIEHALDQAARGTILNAQGAEGCRRLIHVQGADTRDITVKDCRAPAGASAVTFEHAALRKAVRVS